MLKPNDNDLGIEHVLRLQFVGACAQPVSCARAEWLSSSHTLTGNSFDDSCPAVLVEHWNLVPSDRSDSGLRN